jgi:hypothetical protein
MKTKAKKPTSKKKPARRVAEQDNLAGFTNRMLLSMVFDGTQLKNTTERLFVQITTLAEAHGIRVPSPETV